MNPAEPFGKPTRFRLVLRTSFSGRTGLECLRKMFLWQLVMTLNRTMAPAKRGALLAVAAAAVLALAAPAAAQNWGGDRYYGGGYRYYRQSPQRDFFFPFSGFMRP